MTPPKPPQELADAAKASGGAWKCTGKILGPDMKNMIDMTAKITFKLENGGWWLHLYYDAKMGPAPYHFDEYTTFDAAAKKWRRVMLEDFGGQATGTSNGPSGGKADWELQGVSSAGPNWFRDHEDWSDPKAFKSWGEFSADGKTFTKMYEQTCKR